MPISRAEGWKIALSLPGSTETLWFHKPAVFIHDRFLTKVHDKEEAMVLQVGSMEMRDMMLEAEPNLFYITDHYRNFPFVLARLRALDLKSVKDMLVGRATQLAQMPKRKAKKAAPKKKSPGRLSTEFLVTGLQCPAHAGAETQILKRICARMVRRQRAHCAGCRLGCSHTAGIYRHP